MAKITYTDKVSVATGGADINTWRDNDANEVKTVVNENDTINTSTSNTVLFDRIQGYRHGTWGTPIVGTINLNTSGAVEGGCAVVIWNGSSSPVFTGGVIQSYSGNVTESGTYSIYIHYVSGRFNINVFNVDGYVDVGDSILFSDDFTGTVIDTNKWTIVNPGTPNIVFTQNNELIATSTTTLTGSLADYIISNTTWNKGDYPRLVLRFDVVAETNSTTNWWIALSGPDATIDRVYFGNPGAVDPSNNFNYILEQNNSISHNVDATTVDGGNISAGCSFKAIIDDTTVDITQWNGSAWERINLKSHTARDIEYSVRLGGRGSTTNVNSVARFNNVYLTYDDFVTFLP